MLTCDWSHVTRPHYTSLRPTTRRTDGEGLARVSSLPGEQQGALETLSSRVSDAAKLARELAQTRSSAAGYACECCASCTVFAGMMRGAVPLLVG